MAAGFLDPAPRNFQGARGLSRERVLKALFDGRPGTAMRPFNPPLDAQEIALVADFLLKEFVLCRRRNTAYHTAANGWPDHEARYGAAYPFINGDHLLGDHESGGKVGQSSGLALFRESCVVCHDSFAIEAAQPALHLARRTVTVADGPPEFVAAASGDESMEAPGEEDHHDDHEYEYSSPHDASPVLHDLTPQESRGETLYKINCAQCHAGDGTAKNWIGSFLQPQAIDFTSPQAARQLDDETLRRTIMAGVPNSSMPAFRGVLEEPAVDDIIAYLKRAFLQP